jgi:hypothetical protein
MTNNSLQAPGILPARVIPISLLLLLLPPIGKYLVLVILIVTVKLTSVTAANLVSPNPVVDNTWEIATPIL